MKKTSISTIVCLDIIDFSKKKKSEQTAVKEQFNALVDLAVVDIAPQDRAVVHAETGAVITCTGLMEDALEDALLIALTIRDEVINSNANNDIPFYVHIGINLGSASVDANNHVVGDGLVEAQQIMSFANPNQILVSNAYYDMASKLTLEVAQMFEKYDLHAYEDDIFAVRLLTGKPTESNLAAASGNIENENIVGSEKTAKSSSWRAYVLPLLLGLIMLSILIKWMQHDNEVNSINGQEATELPEVMEPITSEALAPLPEAEVTQEIAAEDDIAQPNAAAKKKTMKKAVVKAKSKSSANSQEKEPTRQLEEAKPVASKTPPNTDSEKSTWDTIKDSVTTGSEQECTQAEVALNQCKK